MNFIRHFLRYIKNIPLELKYIILLYPATRIILAAIGVMSHLLLHKSGAYSGYLWLDIWRQWDSNWYIIITKSWYPKGIIITKQCSYGFFPLFPLLMKIAAFFVKNVLLAGLIVSNLSFLAACLILVKLVKLEYGQQVGLDSLASMFFFPTAFILSGVFSESLYLALALACFYFAKKEKWSLTGICGFFLSLSRPEGFLIAIPLFYLYLKQRKFSFLNIKPNALFLFLIPLGLFTFLAYTHYRIGDWFAYVYAKRYWEAGLFNPFDNISYALFQSHNVAYIFGVSFFLAIIILLTSYYRFIGFAYWFFGA